MVALITYLIINAIVGLLMFEYAWHKVKSIRNVNEERDSKYPGYRRYDAIKW